MSRRKSRKSMSRKLPGRKVTRRKVTRRKVTGRKISKTRKNQGRKVTRRRSRSRGSKVRSNRLRNSSTMNKARSKSRMTLKGGALPIADQINEFLNKYNLHMVRHGYSCGNFKQGLTMRNPRAKLEGKMDVDPYLSKVGMVLSRDHPDPYPDESRSIFFASPLIRAQQTCVEMFNPKELIIMPYCGEHQSSLDLDLDFFNDNFPDKKVWGPGSIEEDTLKDNIKKALLVTCSNGGEDCNPNLEELNIDVSRFFNTEGLTPYQIAIKQPDIIEFFENLIEYVTGNNIPEGSKLYVVSHSHFMKDLGLYAPESVAKPFNNSIYKIKVFDSEEKKFSDYDIMDPGATKVDIESAKGKDTDHAQIKACNDLKTARGNL